MSYFSFSHFLSSSSWFSSFVFSCTLPPPASAGCRYVVVVVAVADEGVEVDAGAHPTLTSDSFIYIYVVAALNSRLSFCYPSSPAPCILHYLSYLMPPLTYPMYPSFPASHRAHVLAYGGRERAKDISIVMCVTWLAQLPDGQSFDWRECVSASGAIDFYTSYPIRMGIKAFLL